MPCLTSMHHCTSALITECSDGADQHNGPKCHSDQDVAISRTGKFRQTNATMQNLKEYGKNVNLQAEMAFYLTSSEQLSCYHHCNGWVDY